MSAAQGNPSDINNGSDGGIARRTIASSEVGALLEDATGADGARRSGRETRTERAETDPRLRELLGSAQETARDILEAEDALRLVRERFEHTEDPQMQGQLAADALHYVERQLELTRERRRNLDGVEAKLWARRNRLERFLIHALGSSWWRARNGAERERPYELNETTEVVRGPSRP